MPLVSTKIVAGANDDQWKRFMKRTNPNKRAIALGHPVGASDARILLTITYELKRRGGGSGACGIYGGLAQGEAAFIRID